MFEENQLNYKKHILLTGAGFTHNFGTPLASGMWAEIFNQTKIQSSQELRKRLLKDFDYESIYTKILNSNAKLITDKDKESIKSSVKKAGKSAKKKK